MLKIQFETDEERIAIIKKYIENGLYLTEEQNLLEGRFLIFDETPNISSKDKFLELEDRTTAQADYLLDVDFRLSIVELGL